MTSLSSLGHDERSARTVLSLVAAPNDPSTGPLLGQVGAVELLRLADADGAVPGFDQVVAAVWRERLHIVCSAETLATQMATFERQGLRVLIPGEKDWPVALNDLGARTPYALWTRGETALLAKSLADRFTLTGARASTAYGDHMAIELASDLALSGRVVVAGGAYGIEAIAHQSALASGGRTIAVLAGGVDRAYPAGHADLFARIEQQGLLVSEVAPGVAPTRQRFLDRGRIMAALSSTTVIVEAGARSGSLRVADEAVELGRSVGAVPGPVTSAASYGSNILIQDRRARLLTGSEDVLRLADEDKSNDRNAELSRAFRIVAACDRRLPDSRTL
jgi:DNA processing protein